MYMGKKVACRHIYAHAIACCCMLVILDTFSSKHIKANASECRCMWAHVGTSRFMQAHVGI